jgi:DNA-directed RNA polymerase subunit RPC12/RpoP
MALFGRNRNEPQPPVQPPVPQPGEDALASYDPAKADAATAQAQDALNMLGRMGGRFGGMGGDMQARIAAAQANLTQSQNTMAQYSAMGGGAAVGSQSWLDAILHPQSDFVRQCTCEQCGGPKKLPSPTAYMYCDFCSALVDYDFRKVVGGATTTTMPDPAYVQWINQIGADKRAAQAAGDRTTYEQLEHQFYDDWITRSPNAVSHRVGDPTYRAAFLEYTVAGSMAISFDPTMAALNDEMREVTTKLVYGGGVAMGSMQIDPNSFWPLLDVVMRQQQQSLALSAAAGTPDLDPDRTPDPVRRRIGISTMVQGWMPYLSAEAGEDMLNRTGLQGEYKHVEPVVDGATRHCGKCGQEFIALAGATTVVCSHCGHKLDTGSAEWPCNTCGGLVTLPAGESSTTCPYCKGLVDRVGR